MKTEDECAGLCEANSGCQVYVFDTVLSRCYLKSFRRGPNLQADIKFNVGVLKTADTVWSAETVSDANGTTTSLIPTLMTLAAVAIFCAALTWYLRKRSQRGEEDLEWDAVVAL